MTDLKIPTETVTLPSKGLVYPETSLLAKGEIEMRYMSARDEDILTNINFIKQGTAIDKLLKSLIITPIDIDELIVGDKNAVLFAARILGYGKDYSFKFKNESTNKEDEYTLDLTTLKEKNLDENLFQPGKNEFIFELPKSSNIVTFKFLTGKDEKLIDAEIKGLQKIDANGSFDNTTRLKHMIIAVNGKFDRVSINDFVDNFLLAPDSRALKKYYAEISPDIETTVTLDKDGYVQEGVTIPIGISFFWPDA
mgnify:CR=1 FL=1|jgi:hypothetical protein